MITKKNRQLADTVVMLAFLFLFMVTVSVKIAETTSTNVALGNVVSYPWTTPILNEGVLPAYGCRKKYKMPPVWVCDWKGKHGEMQTYIYIIDNIDIEHPTYEEWENENNILLELQTEE